MRTKNYTKKQEAMIDECEDILMCAVQAMEGVTWQVECFNSFIIATVYLNERMTLAEVKKLNALLMGNFEDIGFSVSSNKSFEYLGFDLNF